MLSQSFIHNAVMCAASDVDGCQAIVSFIHLGMRTSHHITP